jgi:hypothetical protein
VAAPQPQNAHAKRIYRFLCPKRSLYEAVRNIFNTTAMLALSKIFTDTLGKVHSQIWEIRE